MTRTRTQGHETSAQPPRGVRTPDETLEALEHLNWLRQHCPRAYDQLMSALATIVAVARTAGVVDEKGRR